jgi:hypothetical protein
MLPSRPVDDPIFIKYKWTVDELLTAQRLHARYSQSGRDRIMRICRIGAIPFGVIMLLMGLRWTGIYFVLTGVFLLSIPWLTRRATLKHFAKRPDKDIDLEWQISPDRLVSKTIVSSADIAWSMIAKVLRTPEGFLFYSNDKIFNWFPAHAFRDAAEMERLAEMAQSRVSEYDQAA